MLSTLTLSACLLLAAPPMEPTPAQAGGIPQPLPDESQAFAPYQAGPGSEMMGPGLPPEAMGMHDEMGGYSCPHCYHRGPYGTPHKDWCISPCNMYQHYPYWPKDHGYYYFRPYHMMHVVQQRELAASWGEDPRNPYAHKVFDRVYEALRADEAAGAEVLPPAGTTPPAAAPSESIPSPSDAAPQPGPSLTPAPPVPQPPTPPAPTPGNQGSKRRPTIHLRPAAATIHK
jgi:hypothetical protein